MAIEIERKFLVKTASWKDEVQSASYFRQGYLANIENGASVRVRISENSANINVKSMTKNISRHEFEYDIPLEDAESMLNAMAVGAVIDKTRHFLKYGAHTWEVDVFHGENAGLVIAEIELGAEDEAFERPDWLGDEVSHDPRYFNVCLSTHPYSRWE